VGGPGRRLWDVSHSHYRIASEKENIIGRLLKRSISAGVTYCVPDIHCMLLMVGRAGISSSGFRRMSFVRFLNIMSKSQSDDLAQKLTVASHGQRR
jgi:hypothetical protein